MNGKTRRLMGILLVVAGGFLMLQTLGIIEGNFGNIFWGTGFAIAGIIFLRLYRINPNQWWWLIPGYVLLGVSAEIITSGISNFPSAISDSFVLIGVVIAFVSVYRNNKNFWWALIPAGIISSVAAMELVNGLTNFQADESILFLGFSATFVYLYSLPSFRNISYWPLYPAAVFFILGSVSLLDGTDLWKFLGPSLAIILGVIFLTRSVKKNNKRDYHKEY